MLIAIELLFIALLAIVLFMVFKNDGFSVKNRRRQARIAECWSGKDRRQHPRFTQSLGVAYSVIKGSAAKKSAGGKTVDISEGGMKLLLDEKLPQGTHISLNIVLPDTGEVADMTGDVMWTEDASDASDSSGKRLFYSGIRFSATKEPNGNSLVNFIRSLAPSPEI